MKNLHTWKTNILLNLELDPGLPALPENYAGTVSTYARIYPFTSLPPPQMTRYIWNSGNY